MSQTKLYEGSIVSRIERLQAAGILHPDAATQLLALMPAAWSSHANHWIENAIGYWPMPLGIANDIPINDQILMLPLAVEETSIIAGLCKMGKLVRQHGQLVTQHHQTIAKGQIPFKGVALSQNQIDQLKQIIPTWIAMANSQIVPGLYRRGGGLLTIDWVTKGNWLIIEFELDPCDAMGANLVNQVAEYLKPKLETCLAATATTAILSNLTPIRASAAITLSGLSEDHAKRIADASEWAQLDTGRAATHNKGIFNGIDALCIATGNDWRAVNAAGHAFAARHGQYQGLSTWSYHDNQLHGELALPIPIGTVGGVTRQHPIAQLSLDLLGQPNADNLAQYMVACGLLQNLAALYALTSDGIVSGHMRLHINNLIQPYSLPLEHGATLKSLCESHLKQTGAITATDVEHLYRNMNHG